MKLFVINPNPDGTRRWKGRRDNYTVFISEVMNLEAGHVDKYSYSLVKHLVELDYNSIDEGRTFNTIESCKNAALSHVDAHKAKLRARR